MKCLAYNIDEVNISEDIVAITKKLYFDEKIFIYPTDTIYGIGGNPFSKVVVERINAIKGRETSKKFIYLINSFNLLYSYIEIPEVSKFFLHKIWPNPISIVLKLNTKSQELFGNATACFRMPDNEFCQKVLTAIDKPLISTSVNKSDQPSISTAKEIIDNFSNNTDAIFYTEESVGRTASTIIDLTGDKPKLIREGTMKFIELLKNFN